MDKVPKIEDGNNLVNKKSLKLENENQAKLAVESNFNNSTHNIDNSEKNNNSSKNLLNKTVIENKNDNKSDIFVQVVPVEVEVVEVPETCFSDSFISFLLNLILPFSGYIYFCSRLPFINRKRLVFLFASIPIVLYIISLIIWGILYSTSINSFYKRNPYF